MQSGSGRPADHAGPATASLRCVLMRGGTSKAVFLWEHDLPMDSASRDSLIARVFGSGDPRQTDGLGGADPLTSKLAVIGRTAPPGADLTYTFGQVGIEDRSVDYESLCGNITAAVAHFAVAEGLVPAREPQTTVRIFNSNLGRVLIADVPVVGGVPRDQGDLAIAGVPGTGAPIRVDLAATAGARTGSVLPTGSAQDVLEVPGHGRFTVSLVDVGNPHVFLLAADVGLTGAESVEALSADGQLLDKLEAVRRSAGARMGLSGSTPDAHAVSRAVPILGLVGPPQDYRTTNGSPIGAGQTDLVARLLFMQRPHKAFAATSTVCTGVAAHITGTTVASVRRADTTAEDHLKIGHPGGVIETHTSVRVGPRGVRVVRATVDRTARRIMSGIVYL